MNNLAARPECEEEVKFNNMLNASVHFYDVTLLTCLTKIILVHINNAFALMLSIN